MACICMCICTCTIGLLIFPPLNPCGVLFFRSYFLHLFDLFAQSLVLDDVAFLQFHLDKKLLERRREELRWRSGRHGLDNGEA